MDIASLYNESKTKGWQEKAKPNSLPASGVLGCKRKLALRVRGAVPPPSSGSSVLSEGQMHEIEIVQRIRDLGIRVTQTGEKEGWFSLIIAGIKIRGQCDGILPELPGVLEIKSVDTEEKLRAMMGPRDSWRVQSEVYMRAFDLPYTLLFAKARNSGWARQWIFQRNNRLWTKIQKHLESVAAVASVSEAWELEVERTMECGWCNWQEKCWGKLPEIEAIGW